MPNNYISKIKQNNETYHLKDNEVREQITDVENSSGHISVDDETMIWVVGKPAITSTFTINYYGTVYTYTFSPVETPNWNDFINSDYNDGSFRLHGGSEVAFGGVGDAVYFNNDNNPVHPNDNIISEHLYYVIHGGN